MQFDPADFLRFAAGVHGDMGLQDPAGVRTAVSRCYYSALLSARAVLERLGEKIRTCDSMHERIVGVL